MNHLKIGGYGLILMFPLKKNLAKFSCNTPGLLIAWDPAFRQRAAVELPLANEHRGLGNENKDIWGGKQMRGQGIQ